MKETIDEMALRRADFRGGEPIELNGVEFSFAKPCVIYRPRRGGVLVGSRRTTDLGPEFDAAIAELDELTDGENPDGTKSDRTFIDAIMRIACAMLAVNYDLTDDHLDELLTYKMNDEGSQETWLAIVDVARGVAVKTMRDTTGSAI